LLASAEYVLDFKCPQEEHKSHLAF
jgi:hypothetical protein